MIWPNISPAKLHEKVMDSFIHCATPDGGKQKKTYINSVYDRQVWSGTSFDFALTACHVAEMEGARASYAEGSIPLPNGGRIKCGFCIYNGHIICAMLPVAMPVDVMMGFHWSFGLPVDFRHIDWSQCRFA